MAGPKDELLPKRVGSADRNGLEGEAMSDKQTTSEDTKPVRTAPGDEAPPDAQSVGENTCPTCSGSGRREGRECPECGGTGRIVEAVGGG